MAQLAWGRVALPWKSIGPRQGPNVRRGCDLIKDGVAQTSEDSFTAYRAWTMVAEIIPASGRAKSAGGVSGGAGDDWQGARTGLWHSHTEH